MVNGNKQIKIIIHGKINTNSKKLGQIESQFGTFQKEKTMISIIIWILIHINYLNCLKTICLRTFAMISKIA
jgi:hypothetical protein